VVGIELEDVELAFVRTLEIVDQIEVFYKCRARGEPSPRTMEIRAVAWHPPDALPRSLSRDQRRVIERALDGANHTG
jgi:hypothetical protein